jgi:hypothetical protein
MHKRPSLLCLSLCLACTPPAGSDDASATTVLTTETSSSTGGGDTEGTDEPELGICEQYLTCVEAAAPETYVAYKALYGPEGACWTMPGIDEADCHLECRALLLALIGSFPEIDECAECVTDEDCLTDAPYCHDDESLCKEQPDNSDDPICFQWMGSLAPPRP